MIDELKRLLASGGAGIAELELLSFSHSNFSRTYHLTPSITGGFQAKLETGETVVAEYVPMRVEWASSQDDLDQRYRITLQDLNEIIQAEESRIPLDSDEFIRCELRTFVRRRDRTISDVADGPFFLTVDNVAYTEEGAEMTAAAESLNVSATGERATTARVPMLRGFTT